MAARRQATNEEDVGRTTQISNATTTEEKKERIPLDGGYRDLLKICGEDPNFVYRWVRDDSDEGFRIFRFEEAGWTFAPAKGIRIGQKSVYRRNESDTGIIRVPADIRGNYLYLMRIKREWYDEDQASKADSIKETMKAMRPNKDADPRNPHGGQYGSIRIESGHDVDVEILD